MTSRELEKLTIPQLKEYIKTLDKKALSTVVRKYEKMIERIMKDKILLSYILHNEALTVAQLSYIANVITKFQNTFLNKVYVITSTSSEQAWNTGEILQQKVGKNGLIPQLYRDLQNIGVFNHRQDARRNYELNIETFKMSSRIWRESDMDKIIKTVQMGIAEGRDVANIAREVRKYLLEPDRFYRRFHLFLRDSKDKKILTSDGKPIKDIEWRRRVVNKDGKYKWIVEDKPYTPGKGVYKSTVANAQRLIRTEIVNNYRLSQWLQMQNNPYIIGFQIILSNNHWSFGRWCKHSLYFRR